MLPRVATLLPVGAAAGIALLLASSALAPPFQLAVAGKCLRTDGRFGACGRPESSSWYLVGGVVRAAGADGCLTARGMLEPCAWPHVGGWVLDGTALCSSADGKCLGKQGAGAAAVRRAWAANVSFADPPPRPEARAVWAAATGGASVFLGLAIMLLFFKDACAGCSSASPPPFTAVVSATRTDRDGAKLVHAPTSAPAPSEPLPAPSEPLPAPTAPEVEVPDSAGTLVRALASPTKPTPAQPGGPLVQQMRAAAKPSVRVELALHVGDDAKVHVQLAQPAPVSPAAAFCRLLNFGLGKTKAA
ncbi:hypothetical protein KFE25_005313 [Diacronema lutheri]|uniref:Uncharacterized protein n=1 Tax=Diacronema lutheri TaxID=2081491 RepID=A0A8J6CFK8_DIALT|nr:hypothetical protein KFE25_005313 [Diacronema lutheri]